MMEENKEETKMRMQISGEEKILILNDEGQMVLEIARDDTEYFVSIGTTFQKSVVIQPTRIEDLEDFNPKIAH